METGASFSTLILLAIISISFYGLYVNPTIIQKFALNPYKIYRKQNLATLLTSGFVHANLMHLIFNVITLYFFGPSLENMIGSINWIIVYFISLLSGNLATIVRYRFAPEYYSIGASGAISGILFSYILFRPLSGIMVFPIPFPLPAFVFAILYLSWSYFAARRSMDMINHDAHIWGAIGGIITTLILEPSAIEQFILNFK